MFAVAGTAANTLLFKLIPYIAVFLFALGCVVALHLKRTDPAKYRLIGRVVLATDGSGPVYDADEEGDGPAEQASVVADPSADDLLGPTTLSH